MSTNKKLTVGSCFSGIGGLELGLEWTGGFETQWQIEFDEYASKILAKHWPGTQRYGDIRSVDPGRLAPVDLICGGYPCQPFSFAGKRGGESDPRHLWPEMFRFIRHLRPRYVLLENVPGHLSMGFGQVLGDLASIRYDARWGVLSAAGSGAPHLRRRIFIVAHSPVIGRQIGSRESGASGEMPNASSVLGPEKQRGQSDGDHDRLKDVAHAKNNRLGRRKQQPQILQASGHVANPTQFRRIGGLAGSREKKIRRPHTQASGRGWWESEPNVGRVAHGVSSRVDRLRCLGNAVVPQVAQKIGEMILEFERTQA